MKRYYQVFIDLTADANGEPLESNISLIDSPIFETMEETDNWYRGLQINFDNLDIILGILNEEKEIIDTDLY